MSAGGQLWIKIGVLADSDMAISNTTSFRRRFGACLTDTLDGHIKNLNGQQCHRLHQLVMTAVEAELIDFALNKCAGNRSEAAKMLGISRTTLGRKISPNKTP